jgi:putative PIN family toxin of toxin-antitoxin system
MKAESDRRSRRIVLDTNVWISAFLSADGAPAKLVRRVLEFGRPVFSEATFSELETRLWRPKFDRYLSIDLRERLLHDLNATADWIEVPSVLAQEAWCRDADDDHLIRAALAAGAALLVTGDSDLLDLAAIDGLRILTPAQALRAWK